MLLGKLRKPSVLLTLNLILASIPLTLKKLSLNAIADNIYERDIYRVIKRIYPDIFNENFSLQTSGFMNMFFREIPYNYKVDLSYMNLKRIPLIIANKMSKVEKLDLSGNKNLKLHEEWFKLSSSRLKELSINNCDLSDSDFQAISSLTSLESFNVAENIILNVNSPHFISIIKRLKHLDVSYSFLNEESLNIIFEHATNLESLNFSGNDLHRIFDRSRISPNTLKNLKILKLEGCSLRAKDLEKILMFDNLTEIDLSRNNFSEITNNMVHNLFDFNSNGIKPESAKNVLKNLKIINLDSCRVSSELLITKIFDLQSLEILNMANNTLNFDYKEIVKGKARNTLKALSLDSCSIQNYENLKNLTNFPALESLNIPYNNFEKIPKGFELGCAKNSLKRINLENSRINHHGLKAVTSCLQLEILDLSFNDFRAVSDDFSLGISKNSLKNITVDSARLNYQGLRIFTDCPKLESFSTSFNDFGNMPSNFELGCSKYSLKDIEIHNGNLRHQGLKAVTDCANLEKLCIGGNRFRQIPEGFSLGCSKNSLKEMNIFSSNLNSEGLKIVTDCPRLEKLIASYNWFQEIPENFTLGSSIHSLKELDVSNSNLSIYGLKAVSNCFRLEKLIVSHNYFENIAEDFALGCSRNSLKELHIYSSNLNHHGLKAATDCSKLRTLNASSNLFGNIPKEFSFGSSKRSLRKLNITSCKLNINGLRAISSCPNLKILNISRNQLESANYELNYILEQLKKSLKDLEM